MDKLTYSYCEVMGIFPQLPVCERDISRWINGEPNEVLDLDHRSGVFEPPSFDASGMQILPIIPPL